MRKYGIRERRSLAAPYTSQDQIRHAQRLMKNVQSFKYA